MKIDVHITTCHRTDVHCRHRPAEHEKWNVRKWTHEERLKISKVSVDSIFGFFQHGVDNHDITITVLDDGSNIPDAVKWLDHLETYKDVNVKRFPARGSSAGVNDHINSLDDDVDYVMHIEDDHVLFNPRSIDFFTIMSDPHYSRYPLFTLRSGLPTCPSQRGWKGAWGPRSYVVGKAGHDPIPGAMVYHKMGNAHHIVRFKDYKRIFMPLEGNTGGCEAFMNKKLDDAGEVNLELQIPVHAFHSHMWEEPITSSFLHDWHQTGEGIEFGIKNMHEHLLDRYQVTTQLHTGFDMYSEQTHTRYAY